MSAVFVLCVIWTFYSVCGEPTNISNISTITYNPEDLLINIFNLNATQSRSRDGLNQNYIDHGYKLPFVEDNKVGEGQKQRRRKPNVQRPQFASDYLGPYAQGLPQPSIGSTPFYGPGYPVYRPPKRPRPSLASEALSSVTEALTSIALFDDRQCVARLLCEAASGGALGSSDTLQSVAGLQPLLTLLSAYNGISSNPLFIFGRAAFLGMSSKKNPSTCRYAYPLCPTDPEQLVHYLNNHNGGFFRFFNAPQRDQQNINHFYDQLSQNFGNLQQDGQFSQNIAANNDLNQHYQQQKILDVQTYGTTYPYEQNKYGLLNKIRFKNNDDLSNETNRIEKRIQNRPDKYLNDFDDDLNFENDNDHNTKWSFPEANNDYIETDNVRVGKGLKFPENSQSNNLKDIANKRDPRGFVFPDSQSQEYVEFNKYQRINSLPHNNFNHNSYNDVNPDIYEGHNDNSNRHGKEQSIRTVYVVRGNGDPNHPEIIKLRPGQTVY